MTQINRTRTNMQQKREFFRVPYHSVVSISTNDEIFLNHPTNDLSGGGISFISDQEKEYRINDRIKGILYIDRQPVTFFGKIVRIEDERISAKFIHINENQRCKIIQECNRVQLKYRK
ncbi:PilZ domain-containing protein [Paenibacillus glucanolyticus]|uniref:PilZ domain-containing protein n=2 Tax=Paenibacillus TaxID=44249 RepID=A0A163GM89_9BACL|nr:PilZ domain-containing protein [Paenibacillus glucanolyticus]KZS45042.1 hypothetical protein AWU65_03410 [Paenibacillus glucanolyticus]OMF66720.1 hypothetical protein BK142_29305 [Paenibacillus glucanolyticus]